MATVQVYIPDGEYCGNCKFLMPGTVWCNLFDNFVDETQTDNDKYKKTKCKDCPRGDE